MHGGGEGRGGGPFVEFRFPYSQWFFNVGSPYSEVTSTVMWNVTKTLRRVPLKTVIVIVIIIRSALI